MAASVTIVRPHDAALCRRLVTLLQLAGVEASEADALPAERSDEEVVAEVRRRDSSLLVIPFRQPSPAGTRSNGVELLQRLEREAAEAARAPVLLPVTVFGAAAARLLLGEANPDETLSRATRRRVLMLPEEELELPSSAGLVAMHLRLHARRR